MTEPTIYRTRKGLHGKSSGRSVVNTLVAAGVLVPVERCEHGKIDPHGAFIRTPTVAGSTSIGYDGWCPGAGIGGDE